MALKLLLEGHSTLNVARQLGVDPRTVFRWKNGKKFRLEVGRQCQPSPGAVAQRVQALRVPPRRRERDRTSDLWNELISDGPRVWEYDDVVYPDYASYVDAIGRKFPEVAECLRTM
jgi:hypothetical protein